MGNWGYNHPYISGVMILLTTGFGATLQALESYVSLRIPIPPTLEKSII